MYPRLYPYPCIANNKGIIALRNAKVTDVEMQWTYKRREHAVKIKK